MANPLPPPSASNLIMQTQTSTLVRQNPSICRCSRRAALKNLQAFRTIRPIHPPSRSWRGSKNAVQQESWVRYLFCQLCSPIMLCAGGTTTPALMRSPTALGEPHSLFFSFPFAHAAVKIRLTRAEWVKFIRTSRGGCRLRSPPRFVPFSFHRCGEKREQNTKEKYI